MAYPRELLHETEELVLDLRPHWWFFAKNFAVGFALLVFAVLIMFLPGGGSGVGAGGDLLRTLKSLSGYILLGLIILWSFVMIVAYFRWIFTFFVVTSDRVIYRSGIIAKSGIEIPLERVNNIRFRHTVFERIIGAGTLEIESAGENGMSTFSDVRHPDAVQQEIHRCMEAHLKKATQYTTDGLENMFKGNAPMSVPEQIEKLAGLRDQNIISEAEFMDKRQKLLDQI